MANISLTPEIEKYAKRQLASGFYGSMSELVREALRLHQKQEALWLQALRQELNLVADQIDNEETESHNMQDIIDHVDAKRAKKNDQNS